MFHLTVPEITPTIVLSFCFSGVYTDYSPTRDVSFQSAEALLYKYLMEVNRDSIWLTAWSRFPFRVPLAGAGGKQCLTRTHTRFELNCNYVLAEFISFPFT